VAEILSGGSLFEHPTERSHLRNELVAADWDDVTREYAAAAGDQLESVR
jgi:hypothetical protein